MKNIFFSTLSWLNSQGSFLEWMTATGTISASVIAVYFGAIRPNTQRAKFKIHNPIKTTSFSNHSIESYYNNEADMIEVGFLIEQVSGAPTRDVNILVKKVWYWKMEEGGVGLKMSWDNFVPSNLQWAAKDTNFTKGVQRYCHFGVYGDSIINDFVGCVFNISTQEYQGDPLFDAFSSMLPDSRKYEIELMISGENVREREFKIELELLDIRYLGPLGDDGLPVGGDLLDSVQIKIVA